MNIIADPDFIAAVEYAKAIASAMGKNELGPSLMSAGFLALLSGDTKVNEEVLRERIEALKDSCSKFTIPDNLDLAAARTARLPLTEPLRKLITGNYQSVSEFVEALLEDTTDLDGTDAALFDCVLARASACARRLSSSKTELTVEMLGAGAYHSYLAGEFSENPGIAVHLSLCKDAVEAVIEKNKWNATLFSVDDGPRMMLPASIASLIANAGTGKVLCVIDNTAKVGNEIRALQSTAIHEAGHAVASFILKPQIPITQVSIIEGAGYLGITKFDDTAFRSIPEDRESLVNELQICLAGCTAEQIKYGDNFMNEGAVNDIEVATKYAWNSIALGMEESFGPISLSALEDTKGYAHGYLSHIAQETLRNLLKKSKEDTLILLKENWHYVESLARSLIERKTLNTNEIIESLIAKGIANWPGVRAVKSRPLEREVEFAKENGICETLEGPVGYRAGDAIVTGAESEKWPVAREVFEKLYVKKTSEKQTDARRYLKVVRQALAIKLTAKRTIALLNGRGVLRGEKGDWVVDYGNGDLSIVNSTLFEHYYELVL